MNKLKRRTSYHSIIFIISSTLFLSCITKQGQGINFKAGDWASVLKQAKSTNKLIFVDVYTTWCRPCKQMDKHIFSNKDIGDYFNSHFISYKLDAEKGEGIALSKKYSVNSYPNLLFVDGNGKLLLRSGSMDVKEMLAFGKKAKDYEKETIAMTSEYNAGNRTQEFILKYLSFLKERDLPTEDIMLDYLSGMEKQQWVSEENLPLIKKYIQSPYNEVIEYLFSRRAELVNTEGDFWIPSILDTVFKKHLEQILNEGGDLNDIDKLLAHVSLGLLNPKEVAYYDFFVKKSLAKKDQDWDRYVKHTITYVNTYSLDQPTALNNYAWGFYKNDAITDPVALNTALKWINRALQSRTDYNFLDTKAALLYKLNRKEDALTVANDAVKLAEQNGSDASETLKLIEKIKAL